MHIEIQQSEHGREVRLDGELTIAHLASAKSALAAENVDGLQLELSGVERIDSAGLQFLLALAPGAGGGARISACSAPVQTLIDLYNVAASLALSPQSGEAACLS